MLRISFNYLKLNKLPVNHSFFNLNHRLIFILSFYLVPLLGSIMDVRNNEENVMLQTFLNCPIIWPKIRELVRAKMYFVRCLFLVNLSLLDVGYTPHKKYRHARKRNHVIFKLEGDKARCARKRLLLLGIFGS